MANANRSLIEKLEKKYPPKKYVMDVKKDDDKGPAMPQASTHTPQRVAKRMAQKK